MEITRCRCGHVACKKYEFSDLMEGKFTLEDVPDMIEALERFSKPELDPDNLLFGQGE